LAPVLENGDFRRKFFANPVKFFDVTFVTLLRQSWSKPPLSGRK
jgi:hypothetical protein